MTAPNINREVKKAVEALTHLQRRTLPGGCKLNCVSKEKK